MNNKPWHDAVPGELWVFTLDGRGEKRSAAVYQHIQDGEIYVKGEGISTRRDDHHIVDGVRVYPPLEASAPLDPTPFIARRLTDTFEWEDVARGTHFTGFEGPRMHTFFEPRDEYEQERVYYRWAERDNA
jgi:hypothetical protein